ARIPEETPVWHGLAAPLWGSPMGSKAESPEEAFTPPMGGAPIGGIARFATGPKGLAAKVEAGLDLPDVSRLRKLYRQGVKLGGNKGDHAFADTLKRIPGEEAPQL